MSNDLWAQYSETRSVEIRNLLAENYLPLVRIVCGRLAVSLPAHIDKDDLLSSGFFGLLEAIERFDPTRNIKFETYASLRIRGAMLDYLRSKDWIPVSLRQKIRSYEKVLARLYHELGREPSDNELASALGITVAELNHLITQANCATLIPLEDYLSSEAQDTNPAHSTELLELKDSLAKAIDLLPEKERLVISLYYYDDLTLKEISKVLHLTEARISQLHTKAVFRLRSLITH